MQTESCEAGSRHANEEFLPPTDCRTCRTDGGCPRPSVTVPQGWPGPGLGGLSEVFRTRAIHPGRLILSKALAAVDRE